ncbi:hypothetical protein LZ31DRAFT_279869 [Colletotrichum somersetense]|nr:hypothetical protein LZ31DRAFT_279869 [Colletotrichum somersetense]
MSAMRRPRDRIAHEHFYFYVAAHLPFLSRRVLFKPKQSEDIPHLPRFGRQFVQDSYGQKEVHFLLPDQHLAAHTLNVQKLHLPRLVKVQHPLSAYLETGPWTLTLPLVFIQSLNPSSTSPARKESSAAPNSSSAVPCYCSFCQPGCRFSRC